MPRTKVPLFDLLLTLGMGHILNSAVEEADLSGVGGLFIIVSDFAFNYVPWTGMRLLATCSDISTCFGAQNNAPSLQSQLRFDEPIPRLGDTRRRSLKICSSDGQTLPDDHAPCSFFTVTMQPRNRLQCPRAARPLGS